jgi:hypothetical protein
MLIMCCGYSVKRYQRHDAITVNMSQKNGYRSTGGEPCSSAGRKIGSEYEFKSNKVRNAFFHDRALTTIINF